MKFIDILLYAGIGNIIFIIIIIISLKKIFKENDKKLRVISFLKKLFFLSIIFLLIWFLLEKNIKKGEKIEYGKEYLIKNDTILNFQNVSIYIPSNYFYIIKEKANYKKILFGIKKSNNILSSFQLIFINKENDKTIKKQIENIFDDTFGKENLKYINNNILFNNINFYNREFDYKINDNINRMGVNFSIKDNKIIFFVISVGLEQDSLYFEQAKSIINYYLKHNTFNNYSTPQ